VLGRGWPIKPGWCINGPRPGWSGVRGCPAGLGELSLLKVLFPSSGVTLRVQRDGRDFKVVVAQHGEGLVSRRCAWSQTHSRHARRRLPLGRAQRSPDTSSSQICSERKQDCSRYRTPLSLPRDRERVRGVRARYRLGRPPSASAEGGFTPAYVAQCGSVRADGASVLVFVRRGPVLSVVTHGCFVARGGSLKGPNRATDIGASPDARGRASR
jgi:hypothetical protein